MLLFIDAEELSVMFPSMPSGVEHNGRSSATCATQAGDVPFDAVRR